MATSLDREINSLRNIAAIYRAGGLAHHLKTMHTSRLMLFIANTARYNVSALDEHKAPPHHRSSAAPTAQHRS